MGVETTYPDPTSSALSVVVGDPDYDLSEKITFLAGADNKVLIYNAAETGSLRFTISFSGASTFYASSAAALMSMAALTWF